MKLVLSSVISEIDNYLATELGTSTLSLMQKSGEAVAERVKSRIKKGGTVVLLAGKGNNGGDAYAAATALLDSYNVIIYDIFGKGQKTAEGRHFLDLYLQLGGEIRNFDCDESIKEVLRNADCIVDAVFGTGFCGVMPKEILPLAIAIRESVEAYKIAIDVPLGINADNGSVSDYAISVNETVELSYIKPGIVSYPARSYVGKVVYDDLGIPRAELASVFSFKYHLIDRRWARANLPTRENNSNKGSFGKLLMITGSEKYRGAAHLSLEAALRGGVGLVTFMGVPSLTAELSSKYPEAIYKELPDDPSDEQLESIVRLADSHSATLVGSGSGNTSAVLSLVLRLLSTSGTPIILDADAINSLASIGKDGVTAIKNAKRKVILTPHPLEFARLSGTDVASVQQHRLEAAEKFACENKCVLVLKGAGTVITDGEEVFINAEGSSSLAKAGSGDVLAGLLSSFVASGQLNCVKASALAVCLHAIAGDTLANSLSTYGVTPSDLPTEIARIIAEYETVTKPQIIIKENG